MPEIDLQGTPLNVTWSRVYYPWKNGYEGFEYRDDLSWTKGRHQFKFGFSCAARLQEPAIAGQHPGNRGLQLSSILRRLLHQFPAWRCSQLYSQLQYLAGKHWVNNNYGFYVNDNWHVTPRLTLNLGLRYDGLPHAFERYNQFANFVPADYDPVVGQSGESGWHIEPGSPFDFPSTGTEQFYLNGIREAGVNGFPRGNVQNTINLGASRRLCL